MPAPTASVAGVAFKVSTSRTQQIEDLERVDAHELFDLVHVLDLALAQVQILQCGKAGHRIESSDLLGDKKIRSNRVFADVETLEAREVFETFEGHQLVFGRVELLEGRHVLEAQEVRQLVLAQVEDA